jgi:transketolase
MRTTPRWTARSTLTTIEPVAAKWAAFGWHAVEVDGHDVAAIGAALADAHAEADRPSVLVCRTSTVHGLDCLPPDADGHFIKLPPELAEAALAELTAAGQEAHRA